MRVLHRLGVVLVPRASSSPGARSSGTLTAALAAVVALAGGCGSERAWVVDITPDASADRLCVQAYGAGEVRFSQGYEVTDGALPSGSITFVAGSRVDDGFAVTAHALRGGRSVAEARAQLDFEAQGFPVHTLRLGECRGGAESAPMRSLGRFSGPKVALLAADIDGDGRDEIYALDAEGGLERLFGDGSTAPLALPGPARAMATGDVTNGCRLALVASGEDGAFRVDREESATLPAFSGARAIAVGRLNGSSTAGLIAATDDALLFGATEDGSPREIAGSFDHLVVGDLDGDGFDDLIATGPEGARYWLGATDGPREVSEGLPARLRTSGGPLVLADLDGDGTLDLVFADSAGAPRAAINRGDGWFEERAQPAFPTRGDAVVTLVGAGARSGCRHGVAASSETNELSFVTLLEDGSYEEVLAPTPAAALTLGDVDGHGRPSLIVLELGGEVYRWAP